MINTHLSKKRRVKLDRPPWINADILNMMRERDAMKQKAIERTLNNQITPEHHTEKRLQPAKLK